MTKRLISFLLVLCMLLTWLPISHAEETSYVVPEGAVEFCGNDYMVFNDSMTRTEAAAKCAEMGGRLVTITSQAENNFVVELLANAEKNCYWIGIEYDMDNGLWKLDDGEHTIAPYFNWAPNEPNFYGDYEEPYVHIFGKRHTGGNGLKEVGQWNDVSNEGAVYAHSFYDLKNFGYICEWGDEKITDMDGYGKFNGHTYQIYNCAPTWDEAKAHCEALGGHLATITSQEENDYLYHFIGSRNVTNAFFGYTDEAEEGTWVWVNGETSDYTNWHSGEPSNSNKKEHYAMFYKDFKDGTWNDDQFPTNAACFICEWDKELTAEDVLPDNNKIFPIGYSFEEDSYPFSNFASPISKRYFTTMYERAAAKTLYSRFKKTAGMSGHCFGITYTTAAIYNGHPSLNSFSTNTRNIRDLTLESILSIGKHTLSVCDYIKYAQIWQNSSQHASFPNHEEVQANDLFEIVKEALSKNEITVAIRLIHKSRNDKGAWEYDYTHRVLAIGIEGNDILIDDSNSREHPGRLTVKKDGSWDYRLCHEQDCFHQECEPVYSYSGSWNDTSRTTNSDLGYHTSVTLPYNILLTGNSASTNIPENATFSTEEVIPETYIEGMERVDADKMLLCIESDFYQLANTDICQIAKDSAEETADLFWISNDDTITLSGLEGESTVRLASDDLLIGVETVGGGDVVMTNTGTSSDITLSTAAGDSCTFTVETTGSNEEDVILVVSGTAADTTITLHQNDSQVTVDGLENGTVSVYEDEQPVREEPLPQDGGEIDIVYDPTGETDDLEISGTVNPFTDVEEGRFYYEPVLWAVGNGITYGLSDTEFGTEESCKRSHVVTFLWRAAGSPEPETTAHSFVDVKKGSFYEKAVLWAVEQGITVGTDTTHFDPDLPCTRAQVVTFLWRAAGKPAASGSIPFKDVPASKWYAQPVLWAVQNGITYGMTDTEFDTDGICTRAQVVTFLYRVYN